MPAELATTLTATDAERLEQAEALVRGFCGWHIAPSRPAQTYRVRTYGGRDIFLPSLYVTAITSVTEAGTALVVDDDYTWLANVSVLRRVGLWADDEEVVVTFTHGYTTPPAEVTAIVQAVAQRAVQNPGSLTRKQVGPFSDTYSTTGAGEVASLALLESEKATLRRYRLPTVA